MAKIDITGCDREQIHLVGKVQAHGAILVADSDSGCVVHASQNVDAFIGLAPEKVLGSNLCKVIGVDKRLGNLPAFFTLPNNSNLVAVSHRHDNLVYVEIEPRGENLTASTQFSFADRAFAQIDAQYSEEDIFVKLSQLIQEYLGYDRVMIYKFDEERNGNVVAEKVKENVTSYYGHHFPAEDIPRIAREMLVKKISRQIPNVHAQGVPMQSNSERETVSLMYSELRFPSLIHLEFLRNMGVTATYTVSIIVRNRLWGIVACQHESGPLHIPYIKRRNCEMLVRYTSMHLSKVEKEKDAASTQTLHDRQSAIFEKINTCMDPGKELKRFSAQLLELYGATGFAYSNKRECILSGKTPTDKQVKGLIVWLLKQKVDDVYMTDHLQEDYPDAAKFADSASGILVIPIFSGEEEFMIWFREEQVTQKAWAGDPAKIILGSDDVLHPRKSFKTWHESVRGHSLPWNRSTISIAKDFRWELMQAKLFAQNNDLKEYLQQKLEAEELLRTSNMKLEAFAHSVAHDLKSPLRGLKNLCDFLLEDHQENLPKEGQVYLKMIQDKVLSMHEMVSDMLSSAKQQGVYHEEEIDLNQFLTDLILKLGLPKQVDISWDIGLPVVVYNRSQLAQVFGNLLDNAIKYNDKKKPKIQITAEMVETSWLMTVTDNGVGIPEEFHEDVFQPFNDVAKKTNVSKKDSTGVGLSIISRIVNENDGTISLRSVPGEGTSMMFTIPIRNLDA